MAPQAPAPNRDTPAMRQHAHFKARYPDCLLFFRMGDFYELFDDDAVTAHQALGITLTERTSGIPMAGVPFHSAETYLRRLVEAGFRVAVCEQVQDPKEAKGVVERDVRRVITPGTRVDESLLDDGTSNRMAALCMQGATAAIAAVELSTGEFSLRIVPVGHVADDLLRLGVAELLIEEADDESTRERLSAMVRVIGAARTERPGWYFRAKEAAEALCAHYRTGTLAGFGLDADGAPARAAGALLRYLHEAQGPESLRHLRAPSIVESDAVLAIDATSLRSLELERTARSGQTAGSLVHSMQRCRTGMGRRLLRDWLCAPLARRAPIALRLDAVAALAQDARARAVLGEALDGVQDIARMHARIAMGRATPRDLAALARSLARCSEIAVACAGTPALLPFAQPMTDALPAVHDLAIRLAAQCVDTPPSHLREGGLWLDGIDGELDEARLLQRDANAWLARYQAELIERSGIDTLKTGYNRVFGYYIELSSAQAGRAPEWLIRKQTLRNAERYTTPELKEFEHRVLTAEARAIEREQRLFAEACTMLAEHGAAIAIIAESIAALDVLRSFAAVATESGWTRPELVDGTVLSIDQGRHPVLEGVLRERFVPNDCRLGHDGGARLALITGPNMAGKSTYIRQCALIALLAHAGSFVPAHRAVVGLADRLFTRIGASDELHSGQSTFMVEMTETAAILNAATGRSLVILDEIGRGTSTLDGLSLAWAITEALADRGCRTLFATHYHEITSLADERSDITNLHVAVREWKDEIVFLHRIEPGRTDRSYGIHVAQLAGVPRPTVERARAILAALEAGHAAPIRPEAAAQGEQLSLFTQYLPHPALDRLRGIDLDRLTPLQAFDLLRDLQRDSRG
ncbi:MAG: DNA mismatch repair protein MutS [Planctomycetes bacterium]|nr:DNA mismatch repair protein MutS [Planctomycetota bacterium]